MSKIWNIQKYVLYLYQRRDIKNKLKMNRTKIKFKNGAVHYFPRPYFNTKLYFEVKEGHEIQENENDCFVFYNGEKVATIFK